MGGRVTVVVVLTGREGVVTVMEPNVLDARLGKLARVALLPGTVLEARRGGRVVAEVVIPELPGFGVGFVDVWVELPTGELPPPSGDGPEPTGELGPTGEPKPGSS